MKLSRFSVQATLICAMLLGAAGQASAYTLTGDTFSTDPGFNPWIGNTNYRWTITTDGNDGKFNQPNQGNGSPGGVNLGIANTDWLNANDIGEISITGKVTQLPTASSTYLQFGLITRAQAERAADWYASGMFNNAAFINFNYNSVSVGDTAGSHTSLNTGLAPTDQIDFEVKFEFPAMSVSGRTNVNGSGWGSWQNQIFGTDNWNQSGYEDAANFGEVAILINMWGQDGSSSTASWDDLTVTIPEPASVMLLGVGALALIRRR